jgi:hypothetical protein
MKIISLPTGKKTPDDLPKNLRDLADAAERGEVESLICACIKDDEFQFMHAASYKDAVVLAALMQDLNIRRMRYED